MTDPILPSFDPTNAFLKSGETPTRTKKVPRSPTKPNKSATFLMFPLGTSRKFQESPGISRKFPKVPTQGKRRE